MKDPGRKRLVEKVLSEPEFYPDEFKAFLPRALGDNPNFIVSRFQVEDVDGESWRKVGDPGEPSLQNSWVNFGGFYAPAGFRRDYLGLVYLRGMVKTGTINTTIFSLPPGYRPEYVHHVGINSNNAHGVIEIGANGDVKCSVGNNAFVQLDNIFFRAFS